MGGAGRLQGPRPPVPGQGGDWGRLIRQQRFSHEHHKAQDHEHRVPVEQVLRVILAVAFIDWGGADAAEEGLHPVANEDENGEPRSAGEPGRSARSWRAYRPPCRLRDAIVTSRHVPHLCSAVKLLTVTRFAAVALRGAQTYARVEYSCRYQGCTRV